MAEVVAKAEQPQQVKGKKSYPSNVYKNRFYSGFNGNNHFVSSFV